MTQFVNPATAAANPYAEPLQLFDTNGNLIAGANAPQTYLQGLSPAAQSFLLNRIFFDLVRDSGREHTGAASNPGYELPGVAAIDTTGALNLAFASYQRAYAAIGTFLGGMSASPYGHGDFLGGTSTVRTLSGGNITIMSPQGQIEVGLVVPPSGFPGYSNPADSTYALSFGVVTEKGGDVDLYANGNISVNQSRVFTLEGGDITAISRTGNIDAGKGAKTVQAIQPANVSYDPYGDITITPYGSASGSGIQVLRALPAAPISNADLVAFQGVVNAGDAGIRVSGNINLAAVAVLNASNIQVGGTATGIPVVNAPNIGAVTTASNTAGANQATVPTTTASTNNNRPSIIIVEVIGYGGGNGGGNGDQQQQRQDEERRNKPNQKGSYYDPNAPVRIVGYGGVTEADAEVLTEEEKRSRKRRCQPVLDGAPRDPSTFTLRARKN
jgi:hypothetical protein